MKKKKQSNARIDSAQACMSAHIRVYVCICLETIVMLDIRKRVCAYECICSQRCIGFVSCMTINFAMFILNLMSTQYRCWFRIILDVCLFYFSFHSISLDFIALIHSIGGGATFLLLSPCEFFYYFFLLLLLFI